MASRVREEPDRAIHAAVGARQIPDDEIGVPIEETGIRLTQNEVVGKRTETS